MNPKHQLLSEDEKAQAFERAKAKISDSKWQHDDKPYHLSSNVLYKKWYIMLNEEDLDGLSPAEVDKLIYDYKGKKYLYEQKTKEKGFNGKYIQR